METIFSPWQSLFGGMLIGLATVIFLWGCGRIMGVSGVLSRLLPLDSSNDNKMRWAFVAGMLVFPLLGVMSGQLDQIEPINSHVILLAIAGLCAGYGTVRGNGCTSGHGVCGISRLSQRSMLATGVFMAVAAITVYIARHLMGWF